MTPTTTTDWRKGPLGWSRLYRGIRLSVKRYRAGVRLEGWVYVPRPSRTSPARGFLTLRQAQTEAESFATETSDHERRSDR